MPNILTIHRTGSVGKTTLASLVVRPRLGGKFFSFDKVEDVNGSRYGEEIIRYTCENFMAYLEEMYLSLGLQNTLTDVGETKRSRSSRVSSKTAGSASLITCSCLPI
jgi:hypothetical protein